MLGVRLVRHKYQLLKSAGFYGPIQLQDALIRQLLLYQELRMDCRAIYDFRYKKAEICSQHLREKTKTLTGSGRWFQMKKTRQLQPMMYVNFM